MSTDFWKEREQYKLMKELNSKPVKNQQKLHSLVGSLNQTLNCDAGKTTKTTTTTSTIITNLCRVVDDVHYEAVGRDAGHRCWDLLSRSTRCSNRICTYITLCQVLSQHQFQLGITSSTSYPANWNKSNLDLTLLCKLAKKIQDLF